MKYDLAMVDDLLSTTRAVCGSLLASAWARLALRYSEPALR